MVGFPLEKVQRGKKTVNRDLRYIRVKNKQNPSILNKNQETTLRWKYFYCLKSGTNIVSGGFLLLAVNRCSNEHEQRQS